MSDESVWAAYGRRATEYVEKCGSIAATAEEDRRLIGRWARGVTGPIVDVGCGPGQWTDWLRSEGSTIEGVDPTAALLESARRRYPLSRFRAARARDLQLPDGELGGVLAWYSLIHIEPELIGMAFAEFARCLRPGGSLAIGFFTGDRRAPFDHAVTTAYYWPIDAMAAVLADAGFTVTETHARTDPGARPHGAIIAGLAGR